MANTELLSHTVSIVTSHVGRNPVANEQLPNLIRDVFNTLSNLGQTQTIRKMMSVSVPPELHEDADTDTDEQSDTPQAGRQPAVEVGKSVRPDYLICLEDGKHLVMLKRHLKAAFGLSPDDYRKRWGLPDSYPMVAPNYAQKRSELAKSNGLGRRYDDPPPMDRQPGLPSSSSPDFPIQQIAEGVSSLKKARARA